MAPLLRDRAGTADLANRTTHFALPTREAARGGDTDRPSGIPRHGGGPGEAHGRPAVPRRRQRDGGRLCSGIHTRHGGDPGEAHAARQPASPARVHGEDVQAPERPTADCGGVREPTSMTTRDARRVEAGQPRSEAEASVPTITFDAIDISFDAIEDPAYQVLLQRIAELAK